MNLLYGIESFSGGSLKHVMCLARGMSRADGVAVHLLTSSFRDAEDSVAALEELEAAGVKVRLLRMKHRAAPFSDLRNIYAICNYIRKNRIDVVHAHSSKAGLLFRVAAAICNVPCVYTPHCFGYFGFEGVKRRIMVDLERFLARFTAKIVISGNEKDGVLSENIAPAEKIVVINNASDAGECPECSRVEAREFLGVPAGHAVVVWVGRLSAQKNCGGFIDAAISVIREFSDVTFIIAGDGDERAMLEDKIADLCCGNIVMLGYVENISLVYSCADIFVSSSLWEGLPYAMLEACGYGLPMIIPRVQSVERVIRGAAMFPVGDDAALAGCILRSLVDHEFRMSCVGSIAESVDLDSFRTDHLGLYRSLCIRHGAVKQ